MTFREMRRWAQNFWVTLVASEVDLWVHPTEPAPLGWFHAIDIHEACDIIDCFRVRKLSVDKFIMLHVLEHINETGLYSTYTPRLIIEEEP